MSDAIQIFLIYLSVKQVLLFAADENKKIDVRTMPMFDLEK